MTAKYFDVVRPTHPTWAVYRNDDGEYSTKPIQYYAVLIETLKDLRANVLYERNTDQVLEFVPHVHGYDGMGRADSWHGFIGESDSAEIDPEIWKEL